MGTGHVGTRTFKLKMSDPRCASVQAGPKDAREVRVPVGDGHVRQAHVAEYGPDKIAGCCLGVGLLERRNQPDAASEEVDVCLLEVMT